MIGQTTPTPDSDPEAQPRPGEKPPEIPAEPKEIGGRGGLDPVRYGDWEKNGRCIDF
ncbi:DUF1674 domain-containing protein [Xanthomonas sp. Kuri4-1]